MLRSDTTVTPPLNLQDINMILKLSARLASARLGSGLQHES